MMYREVINSPLLDVCGQKYNHSFTDLWIRTIVELIYDTTPESYQPCPFSVSVTKHKVESQVYHWVIFLHSLSEK